MDSTQSTPFQPQPISSFKPSSSSTSSKLPIKRKDSTFSNNSPNPNSPILVTPNYLLHAGKDAVTRPIPFKFHRIWTEPDEIVFLQCLVDCSNQSISFPRDLGIFYDRFSNTMSQPYTRLQLSEKIRRLRKKFRVISSRLAKGVDIASLSPHDRVLFDLSKQLWHTDYANSSPFLNCGSSSKPVGSNLVGVKIKFSPVLPLYSTAVLALPSVNNQEKVRHVGGAKSVGNVNKNHIGGHGLDGVVKMSEVNDELDDSVGEDEIPVKKSDLWGEVKCLAKKALVDAFDQSVQEVRMAHDLRSSALDGCLKRDRQRSFEKQWKELRVAQFEVLAKRLRLIVEHSV